MIASRILLACHSPSEEASVEVFRKSLYCSFICLRLCSFICVHCTFEESLRWPTSSEREGRRIQGWCLEIRFTPPSTDRFLTYYVCIYINDLLVQVFVCTFIYILFIYSIIYLFTHFIFIHSFPFFIVWLSILSFFYIYLMFLLIIFVYTKWSDHLLIYLFISLYIICLPPSSPLLVSNLFNVLSKPSFYYLPRRLSSSSAPKCQPIRRCRRSPELRP